MLVKNDEGVFIFEKFLQFPEVIHGFSNREFGTMQATESSYLKSLATFAQALGIDPQKVTRMNQFHSNNISWATSKDQGKIFDKTDGLLSEETDIYLGVATADCIPFLLYDTQKKVVGAVHAGWRGSFNDIITETIHEMVQKGSNVRDIIVGIGPSIRSCCYEFGKEETEMFQKKFAQWNDIIVKRDKKIFLDLPKLAKYQLLAAGILEANITDGEICTVDALSDFYSYRKEQDKSGRFIGIIGRKVT